MKRLFKHLFVLGLLLLSFHFVSSGSKAYEFPIHELGNCRDGRECHLYCEIPDNKAACWSYSVYGYKGDVLAEASESAEAKVATFGITFPVTELGNCATVAACKAFCTITQNQLACQTFAKNHNQQIKDRIAAKAKEELGCGSAAECKTFCEQETNRDVCEAFAKKYHLRGEVKNKLIDLAKTELGCTTQDQCRSLCAQPENRDKCQTFAQNHNLNNDNQRREELVTEAKQLLGCTSFDDCKAFCQNPANRDKCRNFGTTVSQRLNTTNPVGNCTTVEECRKVCQEHPDKCPTFPRTLPSGFKPPGEGTRSGFLIPPGVHPNPSGFKPPTGQFPPYQYPSRPPGTFSPPPANTNTMNMEHMSSPTTTSTGGTTNTGSSPPSTSGSGF